VVAAAAVALAACSQHASSVLPSAGGASADHAASMASAVKPAVSPTPQPIPETHVLTWDALGTCCTSTTVTYAQSAPWLTWVMASVVDSVGYQGAGVQTMYYTQPNRQAPGSPEYTSDETTFAHDCSNNRIYDVHYTTEDLMQPSSAHLGELWQANVQSITASGKFNAIYEDLTDTTIYANTLPCNFNQTQWSAWSNGLTSYITSIGYPVIYNGLDAFGGTKTAPTISPTIAMNTSTIGGMAEGCYAHDGKFQETFQPNWSVTEDTEIQMGLAQKLFFCRNLDDTFAKNAVAPRIFAYASWLLTFHLKTSVYGSDFATPDGFHVLPEVELVPVSSVQNFPTDISQLLQTGGAYIRQWNDCYIAGTYVGPCAVAVNPNKQSVTYPFPAGEYKHTLVLAGQDIYGGGTIATNGPAPGTTVPELSAYILFQ
jgi:hypothetical protein